MTSIMCSHDQFNANYFFGVNACVNSSFPKGEVVLLISE